MANILIIDDSASVCTALCTLFRMQGHQVYSKSSPEQALLFLCAQEIDLILQDMNFSKGEILGQQGRLLFYRLHQDYPTIPVILMTAWTSIDMVVELIKAGAADYIAKPWDDQRLLTTLHNVLKIKQLEDIQRLAEKKQTERLACFANKNLCGLVFASTAMEQLLNMALLLAPSNASVLITGDNGTGKEGIAQVLHMNSERCNKPFIKVNMGALPAELMEAELFGAEAGAYSSLGKTRIGRFEAADGGTLFLDEIGNLPLSGQIKLLRVLQTGEFERLGSSVTRKSDVRVLSATNTDLSSAIATGAFRQDLYYRINVVELHIPELASRVDDILPLAKHFLAGQKKLTRAAEQVLLSYPWPGNVRELQNVCQRALLLAKSEFIETADLFLHKVSFDNSLSFTMSSADQYSRENIDSVPADNNPAKTRILNDIDQNTLERVLANHQGVVSRAAKELGITRQALYRRMEFYGIAKI